jgi:hypothetical protein
MTSDANAAAAKSAKSIKVHRFLAARFMRTCPPSVIIHLHHMFGGRRAAPRRAAPLRISACSDDPRLVCNTTHHTTYTNTP